MTVMYHRIVLGERLAILAGMLGVAALAWLYLMDMAAGMADMTGGMLGMPAWSLRDVVLLFVMWAVMMAGMMLPSATPVVLLYGTIARRYRERGSQAASSLVFASGYLAAWAAFSLGAALAQWGLHEASLLSPMMVSSSPALGSALFIAAGVYQWTPLKDACLNHCRSPLEFLSAHWRKGRWGAVRMGLHHGAYCVGCCWFLMALLFAVGVMNLLWVAALTVFVLIEKVAPAGEWVARLAGAASVGFGVYLAFQI